MLNKISKALHDLSIWEFAQADLPSSFQLQLPGSQASIQMSLPLEASYKHHGWNYEFLLFSLTIPYVLLLFILKSYYYWWTSPHVYKTFEDKGSDLHFVLLEPKSSLQILGTQDMPVNLNLYLGYLSIWHTFAKILSSTVKLPVRYLFSPPLIEIVF